MFQTLTVEKTNQEMAIKNAMLVSQNAYLSFSRARMTFSNKDMEFARKALSCDILQIQGIVFQSIHQYQELKEFGELQEVEAELIQALDYLTSVHSALSA